MSEILHQHVGGLEIYPEVKVPETEIHKIHDEGMEEAVEYFEEEGYVSNEKLSRIMRMARSGIEKISNNGKLSYEKVQKAENEFLKRFNKSNEKLSADEELLAKVFFGNALANIRVAEREKGANHKKRNEFLKEDIEWKHWIGNFVYKNQNNPKIIEEFWREYDTTFNELPKLNENISKISKVGILGEVAAMNLFNEISKEGKTKIGIEQASTKEDMKGIDFIVRFENKYGESKTIIVQVKCVTKDKSNDKNTIEFYSRFDFRDRKKLKNDKIKKLRIACFDYEEEQRNSGDQNTSVSGGLWIEFTKVRKLQMIDNRGRIVDKEEKIDEKRENLIKDQLKLQLELN